MQDLVLRIGKLFLLTMIVLAVGFVSFFSAMKWAISGQEVVVPNVVGTDLSATQESLADMALQVNLRGERYDRKVARGRISAQLPVAGTRIKKGNAISVIVSLGNRTSPIPDLKGNTVRAAQLLLTQQDYELGSVSEIHLREGEAEQILTQFPTSRSSELIGSKVDVLVNRGEREELYVMPDLIGWDVNRALSFLERNKVRVSNVTYSLYQDAPMATLVRQVPEPGYPLRAGQAVRLEVSK
ncbi:MAG: PASTA domain-containing protein [Acidobacteria bacterium]|nr:PASTA domain-containing protein [Acidobacteriota bacterium]